MQLLYAPESSSVAVVVPAVGEEDAVAAATSVAVLAVLAILALPTVVVVLALCGIVFALVHVVFPAAV